MMIIRPIETLGKKTKLKILDRAGFDYELVEELRPFVVISKYSKHCSLRIQ
jgi:hypothetical protein